MKSLTMGRAVRLFFVVGHVIGVSVALMAFSTVWGVGNVVNGFVYFNGVQVIFSWLLMFALYFVPYALMVVLRKIIQYS